MKKELTEIEVEDVAGGRVVLSQQLNVCAFTTLNESYQLKGDFKKMRNLLYQLQDDNEGLSALEFDTLVRDAFRNRGWI